MKIFYSWQSDTPREIGKKFVREALDAAVASLNVAEAERPGIDQDTAGVLGSPVIADTIFRKIREARIVVADVTLVGRALGAKRGKRGKRLINSNVALEVGYAIGIHNNDEVLLKVMNTHYGPPEELPFDLAHRRWPVQFQLAPDADETQREKVLRKLAAELRCILTEYLARSRPPPEPFSPTPSTVNPAWYWNAKQALIRVSHYGNPGGQTQDFTYRDDQPLIYLHVWPRDKIPALTAEILNDYSRSVIEPLCGTSSGWSHERNTFGEIAFAFEADNSLASTTQVFKTGEIWGINHRLLRRGRPVRGDFLAVAPFEGSLKQSLSFYVNAGLNHFGYAREIDLEFGLVNVANYSLALPGGDFSRAIFGDFSLSASLDGRDERSIDAALLKIFEAVHEAAGTVRR
jgi:hypothetical protein